MEFLAPALLWTAAFFALPALMPGQKSYAVVCLVIGALLVLGYWDLLSGDDSAAHAIALAFIISATFGYVCGVVAGFLRLALQNRIRSMYGQAIVILSMPTLAFLALVVRRFY